MENERKTKNGKAYAVEVIYSDSSRELYPCNYGYWMAFSWAKTCKKDQLYTGKSRKVRLYQVDKSTKEVIKTYPEITL